MRLALWQTQGHGADKAANLAALSGTARAAAAAGATLLLTPECWLSGYNVEGAAGAEPANGPAFTAIAALARESAIAIAYGYAERDGGAIYNSAAVVGPDGARLGHYRKTHLFGDFERRAYAPGTSFCRPFSHAGFQIALLICYDVEFPEAVRATALAGADLILIPTALTPEYGAVPKFIVPARAVENQIFVAYCNHAGVENGLTYLGGSCIAAPDGRKLAEAGTGDALLIADLDPALISACAATFPYRAERRPALYARSLLGGSE
ncbi:carbon-nitrogen hydrolase family protein [Acidocella sp. KAb 2-4]|uniref:carbon-nitrogen hydrolase family protein n=1 Tax=Acidocella sp. KAb 2-4 TaxID=2885158 RepID=UPI001D06AEF3|nr:carbon-nitrogen hydrolase family protein [Acidocella sp. KAb 2-4]MCB5945681.1 carbon-nitrogen hydrolase family protein [Acidocella sp. KAb 2-4]